MRALAWLLIAASAAPAATTPSRYLAKRGAPKLVGDWNIHWQGGVGQVSFHELGGFQCKWCGRKWIGHWSIEDGILTVTEAIEPSSPQGLPNWYTWKASLDKGGLGGRLPSGGVFTLSPRKKPEQLRMPKES